MANPAQFACDWPAYWLVVLERAVTAGDYDAAAKAKQELRRLGMDVAIRLLRLEHDQKPEATHAR